MENFTAGNVDIRVEADERAMGKAAASWVADRVRDAAKRGRRPVLWLMAAPSGFSFYEQFVTLVREDRELSLALAGAPLYQFDDYPIARNSGRFPVTFRHLLETRFVKPLQETAGCALQWHPLELTGAEDADDAVIRSYEGQLASMLEDPAFSVIEVKGIGMDGHWGFHGSETPLEHPPGMMRVEMNAENQIQQVKDWPQYFSTPADVPPYAVTCNVSLFLKADAIADVVPQESKQFSVLAAYGTQAVTGSVPSSALKKHHNSAAFLTHEAARALIEFRHGREHAPDYVLSSESVARLSRLWESANGDTAGSVETMKRVLAELGMIK